MFKLIVLRRKRSFFSAHIFVAIFICSGCHNFGFLPNLVIERRIIRFSVSFLLRFYPSNSGEHLNAYNHKNVPGDTLINLIISLVLFSASVKLNQDVINKMHIFLYYLHFILLFTFIQSKMLALNSHDIESL